MSNSSRLELTGCNFLSIGSHASLLMPYLHSAFKSCPLRLVSAPFQLPDTSLRYLATVAAMMHKLHSSLCTISLLTVVRHTLQTADSFVACGRAVMTAMHCMSQGAYMLLHGFIEHGSNAGACTASSHHQHLLLGDLLPLFALHGHSSIHAGQGHSCCPLLAPFPLSGFKVQIQEQILLGFQIWVC